MCTVVDTDQIWAPASCMFLGVRAVGRLESSERVSCSTVFTITIMSPVINVANSSARARRPAGGGCAHRIPRAHARGGGCRSCVGCSLELGIAHAATRRLWFHGLLAQRNSNLAVVAPSLACVMREIASSTTP
eukprot:scaffold8850_cov72-Phaeocystis_antarctica.AAC.9